MRPARVRRYAHLLTAFLLLMAAGFAAVVRHNIQPVTAARPAPAAPAEGAALFERRCARCHAPEELSAGLQMQFDLAQAQQDLERFLDQHGHSSAAENPRIAAWLLSLEAPAPTTTPP